jgi:hypothetical protein
VAKRWFLAGAAAVIVLTLVVAFSLGAPKSPPVLSTCGGTVSSDGRCVGLPGPGHPGATCVPDPARGSCTWFWEPGYPTP